MNRIIFILLFINNIAFSQICPQPKYFCSNINVDTDFVTYGSDAIIDAVINDNTCAFGGVNVNWNCIVGGIQNETWLLVKVNHTNVQSLPIKIGSYNNININASVWGPYNTTYFDICHEMFNAASDCSGTSQQIFLNLKNSYDGAFYLIGIRNESNTNDKYIINTWENNSTTTIKHFQPQSNNCILPTAEFISGNLILRAEERDHFVPRIQFTGDAPFYFSIENGIYDYTGSSNVYDWSTFMYSAESFEMDLGTVRNACGVGTVIKNKIEYLVYSKDKRLISCIPFDSSLIDNQSGQEFISSKFSYTTDRNNKMNSAVSLNGTDDYLEYPGRDLIGENYILNLWVKPKSINNSSQTILSLGTDINKCQKLELINGDFVFTSNLRGSRKYEVGIKAKIGDWQQISIIKDSSSVSINSNIFGNNSVIQSDFEVPDYGLHSILVLGKNMSNSNFFEGDIDNLKYFSGHFNNSQISQINNTLNCQLTLCDTVPQMTLSGYKRDNPGVSRIYSNELIESFFRDELVYQIGNRIPKKTYAWNKHLDPNAIFSGHNYSQYSFKLKQDNIYEKINHLSGTCGTGKLLDTMHFFAAPYPKVCLNFNNNLIDYYENSILSNATLFDPTDNKNSIVFSSNTYLYSDLTKIDTRNYSVSFRFKTSDAMVLNQSYDFFSFQASSTFEDRLFFEKLNSNFSKISFQKLQNGNIVSFIIPTLSEGWHHIAVVFKSGDNFSVGTIQIFLDNIMVVNSKINFYFTYSLTSKFSIGKRFGTNRSSFIGSFDDFKVFQGALSTIEVNTLFNSSLECVSSICNDKPFYKLIDINELVFDYGEKIEVKCSINGVGPYNLKYSINDNFQFDEFSSTSKFSLPYSSSSGSYYHIGDNYFRIKSIENHCSKISNVDSIPFYIKPSVLECLPFENLIIDPNYKNSSYNNVLLTINRFGIEKSALKFQNNSYLSFQDNALKPLNFYYSSWVKPDNFDSLVLFRMGNLQNYYSAVLLKSSNGFKIYIKRNGSNFLSHTIRSAISNSIISPGIWTNISIQFFINGFEIYLNGNLDLNVRTSGGQFPDFYNFPLTYLIGGSFDSFKSFRGNMDDVKFIHGTLNQDERRALINSKNCDFHFCPPKRIIPAIINTPSYYQSVNALKLNSKVSAKTSLFSGRSITLENGFETNSTIFSANISTCPN